MGQNQSRLAAKYFLTGELMSMPDNSNVQRQRRELPTNEGCVNIEAIYTRQAEGTFASELDRKSLKSELSVGHSKSRKKCHGIRDNKYVWKGASFHRTGGSNWL